MSKSFEIESQMILRVPEKLADELNKMFDKAEGEDFIELTPFITKNKDGEELTQFKVDINNFHSKASIIELPCIIESHKTLDDINIFKTSDISQMVYVHPRNENFLEESKLTSSQLPPNRQEECRGD
jgi:transcription initiation factor TFIID subunit 7